MGGGELGEREKDRDSLLPRSPRGQVARKAKPGEAARQSPERCRGQTWGAQAVGRGEGSRAARDGGATSGQPAQVGEMEQGGPGKRGKAGGNGETEPGKGVIREGVKENPRGEGEPGRGYLLGVCPPAVPPESG